MPSLLLFRLAEASVSSSKRKYFGREWRGHAVQATAERSVLLPLQQRPRLPLLRIFQRKSSIIAPATPTP